MIKQSQEFLEKNNDLFTKDEVNKLAKLIEYHSDLYYNKETPIISDFEYDKLFKKLEFLENKFDIINRQSLNVGADLVESSFKKVAHSRPMISLDNTYNEEDLKKFNERVIKNIGPHLASPLRERDFIEYVLEFKFDGLGVELIYKNGKLIQAITRGDGVKGEDVTENVMQIENIPKNIEYKDYLEVRGEVVMPISSFESLNEKAKIDGTKIFSNPRNAASGSLRMKDNRITKERKLQFFAYDLANFKEFRIKEKKEKYFEVIKDLEKLGFNISSYFEISKNIEGVIDKIQNFSDIKKKIDFEIDGLVIKVNNIELWEQIGFTEHHPKYAISYKFPAEIFTTKILSVDHQIGKTGTITPVANLEGVNMGGAIIKRATLHNYEEVNKLGVRIGDYVFIKRAGEVIPKIIAVSVLNNGEKIKVPEICPSCNTEIIKDDEKVRFYCPNAESCPAQVVEKLIFAVGKQVFNIDGLGDKQIRKFYELGFISDLFDIFNIKKYKTEILELEGFQEKSVNKIIENIEKAKKVEIAILINSLSIPGVGKKTSKTLAKLFENNQNLLDFHYDLEELEKLEDIGPEIARNFIEFFKQEKNKIIIEKLENILDIRYSIKKIFDENNFFTGKKVCITGSFGSIKRDDLVDKLEEVGGNFVSSVSKNTDFLVAGEKAGSKLEKAIKLGIEVLNLEEFMKKIKLT